MAQISEQRHGNVLLDSLKQFISFYSLTVRMKTTLSCLKAEREKKKEKKERNSDRKIKEGIFIQGCLLLTLNSKLGYNCEIGSILL